MVVLKTFLKKLIMVIIEYTHSQLLIKFNGLEYNTEHKYKAYVKNSLCHRYYGPACIWDDGLKIWWLKDKEYGLKETSHSKTYSQKQFIKDLNKLWLF